MVFSMYDPKLLEGVRTIHFIGCGGSGTYPLIQILHSRGYAITGSDVEETKNTEAERALGVRVCIGHDAANVGNADLVVYSAAIHDDNPELQAARARGIKAVERSVMLGYISRTHAQSIGVAGTHGKTTTTGMITTMLELAGRDPAAVIGGKLPLIGGYGKAGSGQSVVIEACEYHETFLHLTCAVGVILNIDNDHLEYYGTMGRLKLAFQKFALLSRTVVFNMDDKNTMDVVNSIDRPVLSFGIEEEARFRAVNIGEYKPGFFEFDVLELGEHFAHIKLGVPGYHNIYNALAMCAVCRFIGLTVEQCADAALLQFKWSCDGVLTALFGKSGLLPSGRIFERIESESGFVSTHRINQCDNAVLCKLMCFDDILVVLHQRGEDGKLFVIDGITGFNHVFHQIGFGKIMV